MMDIGLTQTCLAKRILRKIQSSGEDHYVALLNIRNTPTEGLNTSPGQRLFGRRTKSKMPTAEAKLRPGYIDPSREAALKVNIRAPRLETSCRRYSSYAANTDGNGNWTSLLFSRGVAGNAA